MANIFASPMDGQLSPAPPKASQACASCRKQKRKCDKAIPRCSLCSRMGRNCDYSDITPPPSSDDFAMLRQKVVDLEQKLLLSSAGSLSSSSGLPSLATSVSSPSDLLGSPLPRGLSNGIVKNNVSFPPMFFLDTHYFEEQRRSIPRPILSVPGEVLACLGSNADIQNVVGTYIMTIHPWFPFISKKRLFQFVSNGNAEPSAEHALLFLCMKLLIDTPSDECRPSELPLYWMSKSFLQLCETHALLTVQLVQAAILVTAYEIGHGIYPAAYLSVGHCARLGQLMGFHNRADAPQVLKRPPTWTEQEEIRRVWWAVLILDGYVSLGGRGRPLASNDPARNETLPADDEAWDQGEMTSSEPIFVSSPTNLKAGAFARTCQAAYFAGRVVNHKNDKSLDAPFRFSEAAQLHRTVNALASLLPAEFELSPERLSTALALSYSSMLSLYEPYACTESAGGEHTVEAVDMQGIAINGIQGIAEEALKFSHSLKRLMTYNAASISPLVADCLYQAAANYAWLVAEKGTPDITASYNSLIEVLKMLDVRWKVAGEYLKILELTQHHHSSENGHTMTDDYGL